MPAHKSRSTIAILAGGLAAVIFLGFALLFAGSSITSRVTDNARTLHWANATTASASAMRAAVSQAIVFRLGVDSGFSDDAGAGRAFDEAAVSLAVFEEWVEAGEHLVAGDPALSGDLAALAAAGHSVLEAVAGDDLALAETLFNGQVDGPWPRVQIRLISLQQGATDRIDDVEGYAGAVWGISQLVVTLLIPIAAIVVYWILARRRQRDLRIRLEADLETEREVNKQRGAFIAGVSHELRTPLTSVVGCSQILMEGGLDPATTREMVVAINGEAGELARMVEDLLVASRPGESEVSLQISDTDLGAIVESVVSPLRKLGATIHVKVQPAVVSTDPGRVRQIISNLVSNAIKHGGPTVWVTGAAVPGGYLLRVADDGRGIGPEMSARLFEPFVHGAESAVVSGSVGLGLSVARTLARRLGGDLEYGREGDWTLFTLALPAAGRFQSVPAAVDSGRATASAGV